ncbi:hypothetical protein LTR99_004337 [Exophiala xenobiotica]|uniref:Sister chromatid cohesion protein Dcc1 n=1 Tax=Vermiconidia calcicola TaxID=1690605 RepID=A0AAV9QF99_9PEZI|nr:hypothetical protein LTR96_001557 [Exophiala xenobiotica]KAK5537928.1 hypothetical protein LTR23_007388 [Chaetothyriales sp. CCFEE 6169]KAK5539618.1 hypothetical protein LTR25_003322 [Vermiconidia calcicola]KAK5303882.1 hypothetical protein LTR99_004337 [Exophiala xenobiotica]KAK5338493.1 hypothetical protein LTR98_004892 [Exophiala xenobiotica]
MSSSQHPDFSPIPFSSTYPEQNFRLLELPPDLADDLEEQLHPRDPPTCGLRVYLKSAPTASSNKPLHGVQPAVRRRGARLNEEVGGGAGQGFLHLCTPARSWAIKQVSTSNSVYITQSIDEPRRKKRRINTGREDGHEDIRPDDEGGFIPRHQAGEGGGEEKRAYEAESGITTISQVRNILELIEVTSDPEEVESRVRETVPLYEGQDDDEKGGQHIGTRRDRKHEAQKIVRLQEILDDVPAPTTVILEAVRDVFVFGLSRSVEGMEEDVEALYIPSSALLLRAWRAFLQQCAISGVKFGGAWVDKEQIGVVFDDLARSADGEEEGHVLVAVVKAIFRRLAYQMYMQQSGMGRDLEETWVAKPAIPGIWTWRNDEVSEPIGRWVLDGLQRQSKSSSKPVPVDEFTHLWTEVLPDDWAGGCDVERLVKTVEGVDVIEDDQGTKILRFAGQGTDDVVALGLGSAKRPGVSVTAKTTTAAADDDAKAQKKRKWHEKFGAQRNAAGAKR